MNHIQVFIDDYKAGRVPDKYLTSSFYVRGALTGGIGYIIVDEHGAIVTTGVDLAKEAAYGTPASAPGAQPPAPTQTAPTSFKTALDTQVSTMATAAPTRQFPKGHIGTFEKFKKFCRDPNCIVYLVMNRQIHECWVTRFAERGNTYDAHIRQVHPTPGPVNNYPGISPGGLSLSETDTPWPVSPTGIGIVIFSLRKHAEDYLKSLG